jgi:hypothetical protein
MHIDTGQIHDYTDQYKPMRVFVLSNLLGHLPMLQVVYIPIHDNTDQYKPMRVFVLSNL